jgi:mono/diheme cytochrome c family protein
MKHHLALLLVSTLAASSAVLAADKAAAPNGQKLHDAKCMGCHKTEVYTREDHSVQSLQALSHQVENCMKGPAEANWSPAETQSVVEYLNTKFYKF